MGKSEALQPVLETGVIAIIRAKKPDGLLEAAAAIVDGGITAVEFTLNTPEALELIKVARKHFGRRAVIGAGTVLDEKEAMRAIRAGAQFIVTPIANRGAIDVARGLGIPFMPGAFTPTEIYEVWDLGAALVKIFPASVGGPAYIRALRGPMPHIRYLPTGGVSESNAGAYISAGAAAVAVGGNLVDPEVISRQAFHLLTERASSLVTAVAEAREIQGH